MSEESKWLEINKEWFESGQSQPEFCESKGIKYSIFCKQRSKLIRSGLIKSRHSERSLALSKDRLPGNFLPIISGPPTSNDIKSPASSPLIELELPHGIILRIPLDAAAE